MGSKTITQFVCSHCGSVSPKWQGKCPDCDAWNSFQEETTQKEHKLAGTQRESTKVGHAMPLQDVEVSEEEILPTSIQELDRVLGQGFVQGSVCLLGGEPGIGKSTLSLQIAQALSHSGRKVLYVSGEESPAQLRLRSDRLANTNSAHTRNDSLFVLSEIHIGKILQAVKNLEPEFVILDSIQVIYHPDIPSAPGSVNQVRQCAHDLITLTKERNIISLLIGHITKDGALAGPKVLEHLVDVILYFEGDRNQQYRLLRSFKNRFATTNEIGIFEMATSGLLGIRNPSQLFLDASTLKNPGCLVSSVAEGSRALLVEIQALVVRSGFGMAKRTFLGIDPGRANLLIAAMEKILGLPLGTQDIILNIIGGMKISEPGIDLGIVLAIMSSFSEKPFAEKIGVIGEVGLTGEIRPVSNVEKRIVELQKMGFSGCILPEKNRPALSDGPANFSYYFVRDIREALHALKTSPAPQN